MPEAILLCGVPTSGKSSWIQNNSNYVVISSDNIIEKYAKLKNKTYNEVFDDYIQTAIELMMAEFKSSLNSNKNIICDQTHLTVKSRKRKLKMIPNHYKKIAVYFEITSEEMFSRNQNKDRTKILPNEVLTQMYESFSLPSLNEGFDEIQSGQFFNCPFLTPFTQPITYN